MKKNLQFFTDGSLALLQGFAMYDVRPFQLMESDLQSLDIRFPLAVIQSRHDFRLFCKRGTNVDDLTELYSGGSIPEMIFLIFKEIQRYEVTTLPCSPDVQAISALTRSSKIFLIDTLWHQLDSKNQIHLLSDSDQIVSMAAKLATQESTHIEQ